MEKFLIPAYYKGQKFTHGELINPRGGVLADAKKADNDMTGIVKLVSGCLKSVTNENGDMLTKSSDIEGVVRYMPYQTAEYLAIKVLAKRTDGKIEQIVHCPLCGKKHIFEYHDEENDFRIDFEDLETNEYDVQDEPIIHIELDSPIEIKTKKGEILETIENMTFRFPTMNDGITGSIKASDNDPIRRQYFMYASAMTHCNGKEVEAKFKNMWGGFIFDRMDADDIKKIADVLSEYGLDRSVEVDCSCGKLYTIQADVSNFFV